MTITREQVANLQPGDVVEMIDERFPDVVVRGPLHDDEGSLYLGNFRAILWDDGQLPASLSRCSLTVVSRAPRPLYVNHPRTEPIGGDVVRRDDDPSDERVWFYDEFAQKPYGWLTSTTSDRIPRHELPDRLRLLVDGETGQVVP